MRIPPGSALRQTSSHVRLCRQPACPPGHGHLRAMLWLLLPLLCCGLTCPLLAADVRFASPFVDHMVLQRGKPIELWGNADPNSDVMIRLDDQQHDTHANAQGEWRITLDALSAGGPHEIKATSGSASTTITDVLIGDVWLCSGQSNMQFSLGECADAKAVEAVSHPMLRLGKVGQAWTATPQSTAKISWTAADAAAAGKFSAVGYTFAHELENDPALAQVPIGILEDCLGGTVVESWIPRGGLSGFDPNELQSSMFGIGPTLLYNAMIAPLGQTSFKGVIWYQGEGNAGEPQRYARLLPILFQTWRDQFHDAQLPFLVVQLPDYAPDWGGVYWQWIRESQSKAVAQTPNTALAVTINTNNGWNLHPQGKHEIGRRLALLARQEVYRENVVGRGPVFRSARVDGAKVVVTFDTGGDGLTAGAGPVNGFMIAGQDGIYQSADAIIDGDTVVLTCPDVPAPQTVRYAWAGVPCSTLTNKSGLPAAPFRTDTQSVSKGHGEAQQTMPGYTFKATDYEITISGEGRITSLIVRNQQLLSNASGQWGGSSMGNRSLSQLKLISPDCLVCGNNETSLQIDFEDDRMRWTITNTHPKEDAKYHIALSPSVSVSSDDMGTATLKRKIAVVKISGVDRVTTWTDVAADDGKVLETDIPHGETKTIELSIPPLGANGT